MRFEAMVPYVLGENRYSSSEATRRSSKCSCSPGFGLRSIIVGTATPGKRPTCSHRNVPVIYDAVFSGPAQQRTLDANYRAAERVAGFRREILLAIVRPTWPADPIEAGFAVAHGLTPDAAVRAMRRCPPPKSWASKRSRFAGSGQANVIVTSDNRPI